MDFIYKTENTCSTELSLHIEGDKISNVVFTGGCNGNLKAIPILVEGMSVGELESKLGQIKCGRRPTSCSAQLVLAAKAAYEKASLQNQ